MGIYSSKQQKYANYLCEQFGMTDSSFVSQYLNYYAIQHGYYQKRPTGTYFNSGPAIGILVEERNIRRERNNLKLKEDKPTHIRATDLANYTFCPASYAISNSFEIEFPSREKERVVGEKLHTQLKLVTRVENYKKTGKVEHKLFDDPEIIKILNSNNIYSGHNIEMRKFYNKEFKVSSEPDYIFIDNESLHFAVEEKFHFKRDPRKASYTDKWLEWNGYDSEEHEEERASEIRDWDEFKPFFYLNHQVQLITYLKTITDYDLKYGYLVYWYYDYRNGTEPYIHKVCTKKIVINNQTNDLFIRAYSGLERLLIEKKQDFASEKISARKCAGCVVNKYCGHKSKKFSEVTYPYNSEYLKLYPAEYIE